MHASHTALPRLSKFRNKAAFLIKKKKKIKRDAQPLSSAAYCQQFTSHHLTFFTFTALYLASSLPTPEGRAGTDWKPSQLFIFCPLPRNTRKVSHHIPYFFVFSLWLMHQSVN
jgi:hypothetical protein